ncbi:hypothetical protein BpHYR1_047459 [Brachionus plicatilis]|uniref:Uncharacterized protein n=1 Tax=Brachionus plicatilis TaxID=10195 RepID=A0A3M7QBV4_BRAPC|nr:hypothetical protein BpHYR1_047459 [Brachionus plicatilis]
MCKIQNMSLRRLGQSQRPKAFLDLKNFKLDQFRDCWCAGFAKQTIISKNKFIDIIMFNPNSKINKLKRL